MCTSTGESDRPLGAIGAQGERLKCHVSEFAANQLEPAARRGLFRETLIREAAAIARRHGDGAAPGAVAALPAFASVIGADAEATREV